MLPVWGKCVWKKQRIRAGEHHLFQSLGLGGAQQPWLPSLWLPSGILSAASSMGHRSNSSGLGVTMTSVLLLEQEGGDMMHMMSFLSLSTSLNSLHRCGLAPMLHALLGRWRPDHCSLTPHAQSPGPALRAEAAPGTWLWQLVGMKQG